MTEGEKDNKHNTLLDILLAGVLIAIAASFYSFYYQKNYDFFIETQCDPSTETCFYRDCENNLDVCPPNNLSYYNQYTIKARDFRFCPDEDCSNTCKTGVINCIKTECTEEDISNGTCLAPVVAPVESGSEVDTNINTEI